MKPQSQKPEEIKQLRERHNLTQRACVTVRSVVAR